MPNDNLILASAEERRDEFAAQQEALQTEQARNACITREIFNRMHMLDVVEKLQTSWAQPETPGRSYSKYYFLDNNRQPALIRTLLPAGTSVFDGTLEKWLEEHREEVLTEVPPYYQVVDSTEDVLHADCPKCGSSQPVIEHISQCIVPFPLMGRPVSKMAYNESNQLVLCCGSAQRID